MYTTPESVIQYTGLKPNDLRIADDAGLETWLLDRIAEVGDLINQYTGRVWEGASIPPGIRLIANDMMANVISNATVLRDSPIVRLGEFRVRVIEAAVLTDRIKSALDMYKATAPVRRTPGFRIFRVRSEAETET